MAVEFHLQNPDNLKEFTGKDIWVKCFNLKYDYDCYIRILKYNSYNEHIVYYEIPDFFVDEISLEMFSKDEALESLSTTYVGYAYDFQVIAPYDFVTTQEVMDCINSCADTPF